MHSDHPLTPGAEPRSSRFALEARHTVRVGPHRLGQNLEGHRASEPRVLRLIDLAHAACADQADEFVDAEARARGNGRGGQTIADCGCELPAFQSSAES